MEQSTKGVVYANASIKQYRGAGSSECETPNMAGQRLRFTTDRVAHFARNRGNGDVEEGQSKVGGQGQRGWPRATWLAKGNVVGQVNFISSLFGIVA
jgi:hypothetical protein